MNTVESKSQVGTMTKLVLLVGSNLAMMAGSTFSPGLPAVMAEFQDVPDAVFWVPMVLTLPALFMLIGGPIMGFLSDRYGRKPVLVSSLLLGGIAGSAGFFLASLPAILVTRALVGLSIVGTMTPTNALVADYFDGQERAKFMGINTGFTGLMGIIFLLLGGILADINWRYSFFAYALELILFVLAIIFIYEPEEVIDKESESLEVPLNLKPTVLYIFIAIALSQFAFNAVPVFIALFLTGLLNIGSTEVGLISSFSSIFTLLGGLAYGRIKQQFDFRSINLALLLAFGFAFILLAIAKSWPLVILSEIILGFSMGLNPANLTTWLSDEVEPLVRGRANGIYITMMSVGNFATSIIFAPIINATSLPTAYIFSAAIMILTGLGSLLLTNERSAA
ncbi:MAG: MFS transporter [Chloroflexota bacterium]|nr:MFS transporter [Chloroflexota bacterium]